MGLDILLEGESGDQRALVSDPTNLLPRILPRFDDTEFTLLRFIDLYGNTTFNGLQMRQFLSEWAKLYARAESQEERQILDDVSELARRCSEKPHLYLKFYGD
jgi:hypothetical protein